MTSYFTQLKVFALNRVLHLIPISTLAYYMPTVRLTDLESGIRRADPSGLLPPHFNEALEVEGLKSGKARWFARVDDMTPEDPVLILFHGGGYAFAMDPNHAAMIKTLYYELADHRLSIVWVDYTLSIEARFPTQFNEAAATYEAVAKFSKNIVLAGDSCGVHLSVSLLRHLHTPLKGVVPVKTSVRPKALVAVSPWLDLVPTKEEFEQSTYAKYHWIDTFTYKTIERFGEMVLPNDVELAKDVADMYRRTDIPWREVLPKNTLVTIGRYEILRDTIEQWVKNAGIREHGVVFYDSNVHDSPVITGAEDNAVVFVTASYLASVLPKL